MGFTTALLVILAFAAGATPMALPPFRTIQARPHTTYHQVITTKS